MARSPITASKEGDVTSANEEALQFDDDNLKGQDIMQFPYHVNSG